MLENYSLRNPEFRKWIWRLMLPLTVQQLLLYGVNIINSLMFGRFGEIEIAASTQAINIVAIFNTFIMSVSGAGRILSAQYWGKNDTKSIRSIFGIALRTGFLVTVCFSTLFLTAPRLLMRIFSSDPAVIDMGIIYLRIVAVGLFFHAISTIIYQVESSLERPTLYLYGSLISYPINLLVNFILIFGKLGLPKMGVAGAAIGYLCGRFTDLVYTITALGKDRRIGVTIKDIFSRDKQMLKHYIAVIKPVFAHDVTWSFANSMGSIITGQLSTAAVTAYNICYNFDYLIESLISGAGKSTSTIVGKILGSDDIEGAKQASRSTMLLALILGIFSALMLILTGRYFILLYNISVETAALAKAMMYVFAANIFCQAFEIMALVGVLRAGGSGHIGFWTDIVVMWGIAIPLGWLAAFKWHLPAIAVVAINRIDMPLKAMVGLIAVLRMRWLKNLTKDS
ncbi:MAG: polysaccharide biosynthesis C-terminal domain-containing protein [Oscillospiraceae bacterium]|nr:polysaccharide biosynthesis C-terminal domain-containing protein [Oscillospiraceae bacterium]